MALQVKFFGSANPLKTEFSGKEAFFDDIEREINAWLISRPKIEIIEVKQSSSGGSFASAKLVVSVWYKTNS